MEKILIVDDDHIMLEVTKAYLENAGYAVDTSESGEDGVTSALAKKYDLIFMDYHMPGMHGCAATHKIRRAPGATSTVPIIALTGNDDCDMFFRAGMNAYLKKPFSQDTLISTTRKWLDSSAAQEKKAPFGGAQDEIIDFNTMDLLTSTIGKPRVRHLLQQFVGELEVEARIYRDFAMCGNGPGIAELAHRHASSAAVFGFLNLSGYCRRLEEQYKTAIDDHACKLPDDFFDTIKRTIKAAKNIIKPARATTTETTKSRSFGQLK